ncbi:hypothetical protein NHG29_01660 [Aerococcaceae bacterium NML160702]|nr:hypothetical protein [Aerococcaceae bacterium NML160702]
MGKDFILIEKDGMFLKGYNSESGLLGLSVTWVNDREHALTAPLEDAQFKQDKIDHVLRLAKMVGGQVILFNTEVGFTDTFGCKIKIG